MGGLTARLLGILAAVLAATLAGCMDITEYGALWSWRVEVLAIPDLSVLGAVSGVEGGQEVLPLGEAVFLVSSLEGVVYRCSAGEMAVMDTWRLSDALSGGCSDMVASPCTTSFYVIASSEMMYEVDALDGSILASVSPADIPTVLGAGLDGEHIYISDGPTGWVYELFCPGNYAERAVQCERSPVLMEPLDLGPGYILLVCPDSRGTVYFLNLDSFQTVKWESGSSCTGAAEMNDSMWAMARPEWTQSSGSVLLCRGVDYSIDSREIPFDSRPQRVCWEEYSDLLYVGSRTDDGNTLISAWSPESSQVTAEVKLDGFLQDMAVTPGESRLIVLLYE
ncbi:MAG: hypothetical protein R6U36_08065 [Candidatus Fermentibacteraceae bacterium]